MCVARDVRISPISPRAPAIGARGAPGRAQILLRGVLSAQTAQRMHIRVPATQRAVRAVNL